MADAKVTLGRDGMGDANEVDFESWVAFVCAHINGASGLDVDVDARGLRDVQSDVISGDHEQVIREALNTLWDAFCSDPLGSPAMPGF